MNRFLLFYSLFAASQHRNDSCVLRRSVDCYTDWPFTPPVQSLGNDYFFTQRTGPPDQPFRFPWVRKPSFLSTINQFPPPCRPPPPPGSRPNGSHPAAQPPADRPSGMSGDGPRWTKYECVRRVGCGAMGAVYLAEGRPTGPAAGAAEWRHPGPRQGGAPGEERRGPGSGGLAKRIGGGVPSFSTKAPVRALCETMRHRRRRWPTHKEAPRFTTCILCIIRPGSSVPPVITRTCVLCPTTPATLAFCHIFRHSLALSLSPWPSVRGAVS